MPTFIDESGDIGHHPVDSSRFFRLAAVRMPSAESCLAFERDIAALRVRFGLRSDFEFKFSSSGQHPDRRRAFLLAALAHDFRFAVCSIDKHHLEWEGRTREDYFAACAVSLAAYLWPTYLRAESEKRGSCLREMVVVDDNRDESFLTAIKTKFHGLTGGAAKGGALIGKVKFGKSHTDESLQLADMVCGAVGDHLDGESEWYRLIDQRSLGVIKLP